ncbi:MAG: asparagine--tRNA ligase [Faecalibacterium sp.]|nr:asparagine--tRNA ligase [Faecalibacterium sp.]MDY3256163.1 asparagine--tRNA ligase [Eubacteriales bacterium]CCY04776.1 asparagine--tRNA ligase [Faecalibacterium sp. CAG:1138]
MKRELIKDLFSKIDEFDGKDVVVGGWVRTIRDSKAFGFIELNDGSSFKCLQVVLEREAVENYDDIVKQNVGCSLVVEGKVVATPENKQPLELKASKISVEGTSTPDYPLQKKRHSLEFLREIAYLRPRTNTFNAVFRIRSEAAIAIHKFFNDRGFVYVHTPIITGSDCEGAGAMFQVTTLDLQKVAESGKVDYSKDFFEKPASLTVSGQLNGETYAMAFGNIYTFGPTFRAERSNTARHAAEFWMIEPEMAFADLADDMDCAEAMVKYVISYVMNTCKNELEFLNQFVDKGLLDRLKNVVENDFVRLPYTKAIEILEPVKDRFEFPVYWGCDLQSEHERYITEEVYKKPVFLTDYPREIKAFYMRLNDDEKTVAAADLLVPGIGELIGGSQREERLDVLLDSMKKFGLKEEDYWWYINLRRYGGTKHAGFGLGFERMVMYLTGISNIRDVLPFPRTVSSCEY